MLELTCNELMPFSHSSVACQARNAASLSHSHVIPPFVWLYVMLPRCIVVAGSLGCASHLATQVFSDTGGPAGISNVGMIMGVWNRVVNLYFLFPSLPTHVLSHPVSTQTALFTCCLCVV